MYFMMANGRELSHSITSQLSGQIHRLRLFLMEHANSNLHTFSQVKLL